MSKTFDAISLGHLDVEFFRKELDTPYDAPGDTVGPFPGGPPGIFVCTMAKLGARAGIIATVGRDDFARCIINKHKRYNVDTSHIIELDGISTGTAFTSYYSDGSRKFIFHLGNAAPGAFSPAHIDDRYITGSRWLHISGNVLALSKSAREAIIKAVNIAFQSGVKISLDPNLRLEIMKKEEIQELLGPVLEKTHVLFPSLGELKYITGINDEDRAAELLLRQGVEIIARKEGTAGSTIFTAGSKLHTDSFKVTEVDPTGCGDSYSAAFAFGLLKGWDLSRTGEFANAVGAVTATKRGSMEGIECFEDVISFINSQK